MTAFGGGFCRWCCRIVGERSGKGGGAWCLSRAKHVVGIAKVNNGDVSQDGETSDAGGCFRGQRQRQGAAQRCRVLCQHGEAAVVVEKESELREIVVANPEAESGWDAKEARCEAGDGANDPSDHWRWG